MAVVPRRIESSSASSRKIRRVYCKHGGLVMSPELAAIESSRTFREAEMRVRLAISSRQMGEAFCDLGNAADRAALAFVTFTTARELSKSGIRAVRSGKRIQHN